MARCLYNSDFATFLYTDSASIYRILDDNYHGEALTTTRDLKLFNATIAEGEPQKLEHYDIKWITPSEIQNYDFCPADEEILAKICEVYK